MIFSCFISLHRGATVFWRRRKNMRGVVKKFLLTVSHHTKPQFCGKWDDPSTKFVYFYMAQPISMHLFSSENYWNGKALFCFREVLDHFHKTYTNKICSAHVFETKYFVEGFWLLNALQTGSYGVLVNSRRTIATSYEDKDKGVSAATTVLFAVRHALNFYRIS